MSKGINKVVGLNGQKKLKQSMLEYLYCFQQEADIHYKAVNKILAMPAFFSSFALIFGEKVMFEVFDKK